MEWEPDSKLNELSNRVIGAAIEVHRGLGPGLHEMHYELALEHEFTLRGIHHTRELLIPVRYKGIEVGKQRLDFLVEEKLILELKSVDALALVHRAQVLSYLNLAKLNLGLLINFDVPILKDGIRRVIRPPDEQIT